jgi:hypothetical protein
MEKTTCGSHACAVTTRRMIRSMIQGTDVTVAKREETGGTRPSVTPTSLLQDTLIDVTTDTMIGAEIDATIIEMATAVDPVAAEAITGSDHHGFRNCCLLSSSMPLVTYIRISTRKITPRNRVIYSGTADSSLIFRSSMSRIKGRRTSRAHHRHLSIRFSKFKLELPMKLFLHLEDR